MLEPSNGYTEDLYLLHLLHQKILTETAKTASTNSTSEIFFSQKREVIPLLQKCNLLKITPLVYRDLLRPIYQWLRHFHPNLLKDHSGFQRPPKSSYSFTKTKESLAKKIKIFKHRKSSDSSLSLTDFLLTFFTQPETGTSSRSLSLCSPPVTPLRRQPLLRNVSDISSGTFSLPYLRLSANLS